MEYLYAGMGIVLLVASVTVYLLGARLDLLRGRRTFWYFAGVAVIAAVVFHFMWIPLLAGFGLSAVAYLNGHVLEGYLILAAIFLCIVTFVVVKIIQDGRGGAH
jgi:hypothetical protein